MRAGFYDDPARVSFLVDRLHEEMMMSKHTPGPWFRMGEWNSNRGTLRCVEAQDWGIIGAWLDQSNEPEQNLDLICAAPDMLSQLELILTRLDMEPVSAIFPCSAMRDDIRRVIAKARGLPAPSREAWILRTHRGDYLSAVTDRLVVTQNRELAYSFDSEADAEDQAELAIHLGVFHPLRIR